MLSSLTQTFLSERNGPHLRPIHSPSTCPPIYILFLLISIRLSVSEMDVHSQLRHHPQLALGCAVKKSEMLLRRECMSCCALFHPWTSQHSQEKKKKKKATTTTTTSSSESTTNTNGSINCIHQHLSVSALCALPVR